MPPPGAAPPELNVPRRRRGRPSGTRERCSGCHAVDGDLQGIATRVPDPNAQNLWVWRRRGGRRSARSRSDRRGDTAVRREGRGPVTRIDDFIVSLLQDDGTTRSFRRSDDVPKVEVHDPEAHSGCSAIPTRMHDVTAYLATLK